MGSEKFCLRWNDFESNISSAFRELRDDKDFFDVTIACDDEQISAHKVILSACSPFFRNILRRNPHQHPLLYIKGVKYTELQAVLNFMYHGEVNVAQEELNSFLTVAEDLRVKGLTQGQTGSKNQEHAKSSSSSSVKSPSPPVSKHTSHYQTPPLKEVKRAPPPIVQTKRTHPPSDEDDIQEVCVPIKSEPKESHSMCNSNQIANQANLYTNPQPVALANTEDYSMSNYQEEEPQEYQDYEYEGQEYAEGDHSMGHENVQTMDSAKGYNFQSPEELLQFVEKQIEGQNFQCTICRKFNAVRKGLVRNHVESIHFPGLFSYNCDICNKQFEGRNKLAVHNSRLHPTRPRN